MIGILISEIISGNSTVIIYWCREFDLSISNIIVRYWKLFFDVCSYFSISENTQHRMRDWFCLYRHEIWQAFRQRRFHWRMSGFNNMFSIATQMRWKIHFTVIHSGETGEANCSWLHCPACRTTLIATRFRVAVICPIIQVPHCIRVFFYFVWLCLLITFFNFIMNYVHIVTFWIFTYHKIWILSIMFCFIWSYWIIYFLACLEVSWRVVS